MATTNAIIPTSTLNGIANAIKAKDGGGNMTAAQMATRIANIPTGGESVWDDTYLNDGNTHIWIEIPEDNYTLEINVMTATYDWGDGSAAESVTGQRSYTHTYATAGTYRIDITNITGIYTNINSFFAVNCIDYDYPNYYMNQITPYPSVNLPSRVELCLPASLATANFVYVFTSRSLGVVRMKVENVISYARGYHFYESTIRYLDGTLTLDAACTSAAYMFQYCRHLMLLPESIDLTGCGTNTSNAFAYCNSLRKVPSGLKANGSLSFRDCVCLEKSSITTFAANVNTCANSGQTITFATNVRNLFTSEEWAALADTLSAKNWGLSPAS